MFVSKCLAVVVVHLQLFKAVASDTNMSQAEYLRQQKETTEDLLLSKMRGPTSSRILARRGAGSPRVRSSKGVGGGGGVDQSQRVLKKSGKGESKTTSPTSMPSSNPSAFPTSSPTVTPPESKSYINFADLHYRDNCITEDFDPHFHRLIAISLSSPSLVYPMLGPPYVLSLPS